MCGYDPDWSRESPCPSPPEQVPGEEQLQKGLALRVSCWVPGSQLMADPGLGCQSCGMAWTLTGCRGWGLKKGRQQLGGRRDGEEEAWRQPAPILALTPTKHVPLNARAITSSPPDLSPSIQPRPQSPSQHAWHTRVSTRTVTCHPTKHVCTGGRARHPQDRSFSPVLPSSTSSHPQKSVGNPLTSGLVLTPLESQDFTCPGQPGPPEANLSPVANLQSLSHTALPGLLFGLARERAPSSSCSPCYALLAHADVARSTADFQRLESARKTSMD